MRKLPDLAISASKIAAILSMARQFDVNDVIANPSRRDPVHAELTEIIRGLNEDEQIDLVALTWLGRGDGGVEEWADLHAEAAHAHNDRTAEYLLGIPILGDYLEEALSQFGHSTEEFEKPV